MAKYFFYTDPAKISQALGQEFGPSHVGTHGGAVGAKEDKYQITNLHSLVGSTGAPAIAVCSGMICVQEDNQGTYTIILKPDYQPSFDFPYIKYFLYKGITRDSLVQAGTDEIVNDNSIPFIKIIRDDVDHWNLAVNDITKSKGILGLDYKPPFSYLIDTKSVSIFEDDQPIDNFFYYPNPDFQLPTVKAGEKIGLFEDGFGFEIVLERLGYEPKIKLARTKVNYIEVDAILNPLNEVGHSSGRVWAVDDADYFLHWHEKEACLNYIDPCAFYGSFCGTKVFYMDSNGDRKKCNTPEEIYTEILDVFLNKNKIYLDIRNDYGYSLNYFKDYGETISFINGTNNALNTAFKTTRDYWPICNIDISEIASVGNVVRDKFFKTQLALPNNNNNVPLVYLSKAYVQNFRRLKRKHRIQFPSKTLSTDFLEPIDITFVTVQDGTTDVFLSNYYKVNLYDKDINNSTTNTSLAPSKEYYLNGLFRPLDLKQSLIIKDNNFRFTIWHEELLVDQTEYGGPQFIAQVGIAEDEHHTTLFAFPYYFVHGGFSNNTPDAFTTWANQSKESKKMFLQDIFDLFTNKELRKQEITIDDPVTPTVEKLDTVVVKRSPFNFIRNAFRQNENPEDYVFIMFDKGEYDTILTSLSNHSNMPEDLAVYLKKDTISTEVDDDGVKYTKLVLDASRFEKVGTSLNKESINVDKNIFEYADF